jgi:hypothetical protein
MRSRRWSQSWPLAADPVFGGCQPSRFQTTGAHPPGLFRADQPALFQHPQMLQRWQRHRQRLGGDCLFEKCNTSLNSRQHDTNSRAGKWLRP